MRQILSALAILALLALPPGALADDKTPPSKPEDDRTPTGTLFTQNTMFVCAIYLLPGNKADPDAVLKDLLTKDKIWTHVAKIPDDIELPTIKTDVITDVAKSYTPPSIESLKYFGKGISKEQGEQVQQSPEAYVLIMTFPSSSTWKCVRDANALVGNLAAATNGLVWDEATRELFSPESWKKERVDTWPAEGVPDLRNQVTIHAYKDGEYVRAITLGMSKFGLPDISVSNFSWSTNRQVGNLVNMLVQQFAEGAQLAEPGQFDLDIRKIKQDEVRARAQSDLGPHAEQVAKLTLKKGKPEQGDNDNRQIEITFDRYDGADVHARQEAMVSSFYGSTEKIKSVKHDDEINAARDRARAKLPDLSAAFNKGLAPGEFIDLKAPFPYDGGTEWMWVEVTAWDGDKIKGLLKNEPFHIPSLHGGQVVEVSQKDIFDFIHYFPDGHDEGNETGKLIEKKEGETETK